MKIPTRKQFSSRPKVHNAAQTSFCFKPTVLTVVNKYDWLNCHLLFGEIDMNLNATKRPFGHFDVNVLKLGNSENIMSYAFLK